MKKILFLFVLLLSFVLFNHTEVSAQTVSVSFDETVSDSFTANDQLKKYSFTVVKAGKITATVTSYNANLDLRIYDDERDEVRKLTGFSSATAANGQTKDLSVYLEPGTYTIQMSNPEDLLGNGSVDGYSFELAFKDSLTTEVTPNNTLETAQPLV